jgi:hypothetical protein
MCRFFEIVTEGLQKKCNHSIDTAAAEEHTALRDFFVNYEHMAFFPWFFVENAPLLVAEQGRRPIVALRSAKGFLLFWTLLRAAERSPPH